VIGEVLDAVDRWEAFADQAGVSADHRVGTREV